MNDVKEICALALATPAPPLRNAPEVLTLARASLRRRRLTLMGTGALALVLAVSVSTTRVTEPRVASLMR